MQAVPYRNANLGICAHLTRIYTIRCTVRKFDAYYYGAPPPRLLNPAEPGARAPQAAGAPGLDTQIPLRAREPQATAGDRSEEH